MSNNSKPVLSGTGRGSELTRKIQIYKDAAASAMQDATEFDKSVVEANEDYIGKLTESDATEYDILKLNMEKAETAEERQAVRESMEEMREKRYQKDTENKEFYEKQQREHRKHALQILGSVAIVAGLVKFRKPLMNGAKALITKV